MGVVIKVSPEADLYVDWSVIAEGPMFLGNREQMFWRLTTHGTLLASPDSPEEAKARLARADATGTSCPPDEYDNPAEGPSFGWGDKRWLADQRWLMRADLEAYARAHLAGRYDDAQALTEPVHD